MYSKGFIDIKTFCVTLCPGVLVANFIAAPHDAVGLARRRMKIMLSISQSIVGAWFIKPVPGDSHTGFDESNPYDRIYITRTAIFTVIGQFYLRI